MGSFATARILVEAFHEFGLLAFGPPLDLCSTVFLWNDLFVRFLLLKIKSLGVDSLHSSTGAMALGMVPLLKRCLLLGLGECCFVPIQNMAI